jgi:signal peptidase
MTPRSAWPAIGRVTMWSVLGFAATFLVVLTALGPLGIHSYVVRSGSMQPAIDRGDVVVDRAIPPADARIGDTITFKDPVHKARTITHRVRAVSRHGNIMAFTTMGLANKTPEHWNVRADGEIGRVTWRIPKLGRAVSVVSTPIGVLLLVVLPALGLMGLHLHRIWSSAPSPPE